MTLSLTGKTAIVTGAAHGIGAAIARHFAERGARVMCTDADEATLARDLGNAAHVEGTIRWFAGDLRRRLTINNLLATTLDAFDHVDILVNAEHGFATSDPLDPRHDAVESLWQQNVLTALRLSQQVATRMIAQARNGDDDAPAGSIINLASIAARVSQPELLGYSLACAGVEQVTRSLALALAPHRIRVNCLSIGSVMGARLQTRLKDNPAWREEIRRATPLRRIAPPSEVVEAAQFLASDASGFITGQVLMVDGGRSLLDAARPPVH